MHEPEVKKYSFAEVLDHSGAVTGILLLALFLMTLLVVIWPRRISKDLPVRTQVMKEAVYAQVDFAVDDVRTTEKKRARAREKEADYYKLDMAAIGKAMERFSLLIKELSLKEQAGRQKSQYICKSKDPLITRALAELPKPTVQFLLSLEENREQLAELERLIRRQLGEGILAQELWENLKNKSRIVVMDHYGRNHVPLTTDQIWTPSKAGNAVMQKMLEYYDASEKSLIERSMSALLAELFRSGTLIFDASFTEGKKGEAAGRIPMSRRTFQKGDILIGKGQAVTDEDLNILNAHQQEITRNSSDGRIFLQRFMQNFALCFVLLLTLCLYFHHIRPDLSGSNRSIALIVLILFSALLLNRFFEDLFCHWRPVMEWPQEMIYFCLPLGFVSLLISALYGMRSSLFAGLFVTAIASLNQPNPFAMLLSGLFVTFGAAIAIRKASTYFKFMTKSFLGILIPILIGECIHCLHFDGIILKPYDLLLMFLTAVVTALLTAALSVLMLVLLDLLFNTVTQMSLNNCIDFNNELLRRLQREAPGTYHHSIQVAELAKEAAECAGLNATLAYACGLYHDVGKLSQPQYFIENCLGSNPHKDLDPAMSAMIILNHVKEGLKLAKQYKLNHVLREAIEQHHGNDAVLCFYSAALKGNPVNVKKKDFCYPHPCPVRKEVSLIMFADCCEAACRSLSNPTPEEVELLIRELFQKKVRSGLLDQSQLTMREIALIRDSFIRQIPTMMHVRIAYPKDKEDHEDDLFMAAGKAISPTSEKQI